MNINTLCNNYQESLAKKYDLILKSNGCFQTITTATRITACSKTLLDHIITNESELQITPGVFNYQISDHSLTFVVLKNTQCSSQTRKYSEIVGKQKFRCFSNYETAKFVEDLRLELENHFNQIPEITPANFNEEFNVFNEVILKVVNKHAPLKFAGRKQKRLLQKPWITNDIFDAIRQKQKMYKTHFKSGDPYKIAKCKKYATKVNHLKEISKKNYFHDEITKNKSNPKKIWQTLKQILPTNAKQTKFCDPPTKSCDSSNNTFLENPMDIAESFNTYFVNIGKYLADKIPQTHPLQCKIYLKNRIQSSIFFDPPRPNEIFNIINSLKSKKSAKKNAIPSYFIKVAGYVLTSYLTFFFALAFNFGIFPDALKIAAVTPVHKSDDKSKVTNYRPISVLPCLSKILEKLIKARLILFFEKHHVLYPNQYGFRSNHSTIHALLDITSTLHDNLNNKILPCLVMIDLKKSI